jgi:hypothetical protein
MTKRKNGDTGRSAATLGGIAISGLLGTTFLCGTAAPAMAEAEGDVLDLSGLERVTDSSLGDLRGGFRLGNLDITFGVQVTTSVNGQEILQTSFNMINPGQMTQSVTTLGGNHNTSAQNTASYGGGANQAVTGTVNDIAQDLGNGGSTPPAAESVGGGGAMTGFQPASAAPLPSAADGSAVPASVDSGGWTFNQTDTGVQAVSGDFATTIMHEITSAVSATITNTADNQTITNDTELDLFINNFEVVQMQSVTNQVISNMMTEMTNAGALGN